MSRRVALLVLTGALVLVLVAMTRESAPSVPGCPWDPTCATAFEEEP